MTAGARIRRSRGTCEIADRFWVLAVDWAVADFRTRLSLDIIRRDLALASETEGHAMTQDAGTNHCCASVSAHHGYITDKDRYLKRLKRIEGQARGISRMIEDERYCIDILTQADALTKALQGVALALLDDHLRHCVKDAVALGGSAADEKLTEASEAIARLVRS